MGPGRDADARAVADSAARKLDVPASSVAQDAAWCSTAGLLCRGSQSEALARAVAALDAARSGGLATAAKSAVRTSDGLVTLTSEVFVKGGDGKPQRGERHPLSPHEGELLQNELLRMQFPELFAARARWCGTAAGRRARVNGAALPFLDWLRDHSGLSEEEKALVLPYAEAEPPTECRLFDRAEFNGWVFYTTAGNQRSCKTTCNDGVFETNTEYVGILKRILLVRRFPVLVAAPPAPPARPPPSGRAALRHLIERARAGDS